MEIALLAAVAAPERLISFRRGLAQATGSVPAILAALSAGPELSEIELQQVSDWLLLRRECNAHQRDPQGYAPPNDLVGLAPDVLEALNDEARNNYWKVINTRISAATAVLMAGTRLGMSAQDDLKRFAPGKAYFPRYIDRVHIAAVLAKCARHCVLTEVEVKAEALRRNGSGAAPDDPERVVPKNSGASVERHKRRIRRINTAEPGGGMRDKKDKKAKPKHR